MPTITAPGYPDIEVLQLANGYSAQRPIRTIVHPSIDPNDPAPFLTLSAAGPRSGELALLFNNATDAQTCFDRHALPLIFTFTHERQHTMDMVYAPAPGNLNIELDPDTRRYWVVTIPFQEL